MQNVQQAVPQSQLANRKRAKLRRTGRHPFAKPFSPKRLKDADCFDVQIPKKEGWKATVGGREALTSL